MMQWAAGKVRVTTMHGRNTQYMGAAAMQHEAAVRLGSTG